MTKNDHINSLIGAEERDNFYDFSKKVERNLQMGKVCKQIKITTKEERGRHEKQMLLFNFVENELCPLLGCTLYA